MAEFGFDATVRIGFKVRWWVRVVLFLSIWIVAPVFRVFGLARVGELYVDAITGLVRRFGFRVWTSVVR